jgi:predicted Rossmann-fold nucleotide-binding protein
LIGFLDHAVAEDFLTPKHRSLLLVENEPEKLLQRIETFISTHAAQRFDAAKT